MDFHDFPLFLGNLGVEGDHPPKMCAGLPAAAWARDSEGVRKGTVCDAFSTGLWVLVRALVLLASSNALRKEAENVFKKNNEC